MTNIQNAAGSPLLDRIIDAIPRLPQLSAEQKSELMEEIIANDGVTTAEQRQKLAALFREGARIRREAARIASEAAAETSVEAEPEYEEGDVAQAVAEQEALTAGFEAVVNEQRSAVEAADREDRRAEGAIIKANDDAEADAIRRSLQNGPEAANAA